MPFTLGLSWLAENAEAQAAYRRQLFHKEARRILSLLAPGSLISSDPAGRPYFSDNHADFSISHSHNMAAVALLPNPFHHLSGCTQAAGENNFPHGKLSPRTGCDIQYADPHKVRTGIIRSFFHDSEQEYIFSANDDRQYRRFYQIWVLKEAWIKMRGQSVFDMKQTPSFAKGTMTQGRKEGKDETDFFLCEIQCNNGELYMLAVIRELAGYAGDAGVSAKEPGIQWFSQEHHKVKIMPVNSLAP